MRDLDMAPEELDETSLTLGRIVYRALAMLSILAALAWIFASSLDFAQTLNGDVPTLTEITDFITRLCTPLALLGIFWLLALRSSRSEAARFAVTIDQLRKEEMRLGLTLADMARRLDANRASLAEQSHSLAALGHETSDRLSDVSASLQGQLDAINRHAATLETRTSVAKSDMNSLLADMPRAHAEIHRLAEQLDSTGQNSMSAANELSAQLAILAERGRNADEIASRAAQRLSERVANLDDMTRIAAARIEEASSTAIHAVDTTLGRATDALTSARKDMQAQGEEMVALIEQGHQTMTSSGEQSAAAMTERLAVIGARLDDIGRILSAQDEASQTVLARIHADIASLETEFDGLTSHSETRAVQTTAIIQALRAEAERLGGTLDQGGKVAEALISQAETLLIALDASVREIDETLPLAHKRLVATAQASKEKARETLPEINALETASLAALDRLRDAETLVTEQRDLIDRLVEKAGATLHESRATAEALTREIEAAEEQAKSLTETAAPQLIDALLRIKDTANQAAEHARTALDNVVPEASAKLAEQAREALEATLSVPVEEQMALIARRAEEAIAAARAATQQLTEDIAAITAASLGLESRIDEAKDEAVRGDSAQFARRMARLIDAMDSSALSVTKILSADVSSKAWAAYVRGETGLFTRHAVRLLNSSEAREVRRLYADDDEFREQVNLYVRDFEIMLRNMISTRDADALSVTLISSDAGKLYVALAQAIERLRG
ncbi:MAG: hypothetical protein EBS21_02210 [Sphingomonadaceae bacterium]|nr:hypothetical protein [Sphingomonadaceae bacterium]